MSDVVAAYDRAAEAYAEREAPLFDKKPYDRARIDVVLGSCPEGRPILDVGCGPGQVSRYLASKGAKVIGVDASSRMLELARAAGGDVRYERADFGDLAYEAGSIGGVVCLDSLIHLDADALTRRLQAFGAMLAPGAALLFTTYQGDTTAPYPIVPDGEACVAFLFQRKELAARVEALDLFDVVRVEGRRPYAFERPWPRIFVTARRAVP